MERSTILVRGQVIAGSLRLFQRDLVHECVGYQECRKDRDNGDDHQKWRSVKPIRGLKVFISWLPKDEMDREAQYTKAAR